MWEGSPELSWWHLEFKVMNNQAKYRSLLAGIYFSYQLEVLHHKAFSDSQLVVNQVNGMYEIKDKKLMQYESKTKVEIGKLNYFQLT